MKSIDLTAIIQAFIMLISSVVTIYILPKVKLYLTEKLSAEQRENLKKWVRVAVAAAEQLYGSKKGQEKKDYVVSFLLSKGFVFDIDEVTALIESEVYKLTQGKGYIFAETVPEDGTALPEDIYYNDTETDESDEETGTDTTDEPVEGNFLKPSYQ